MHRAALENAFLQAKAAQLAQDAQATQEADRTAPTAEQAAPAPSPEQLEEAKLLAKYGQLPKRKNAAAKVLSLVINSAGYCPCLAIHSFRTVRLQDYCLQLPLACLSCD